MKFRERFSRRNQPRMELPMFDDEYVTDLIKKDDVQSFHGSELYWHSSSQCWKHKIPLMYQCRAIKIFHTTRGCGERIMKEFIEERDWVSLRYYFEMLMMDVSANRCTLLIGLHHVTIISYLLTRGMIFAGNARTSRELYLILTTGTPHFLPDFVTGNIELLHHVSIMVPPGKRNLTKDEIHDLLLYDTIVCDDFGDNNRLVVSKTENVERHLLHRRLIHIHLD